MICPYNNKSETSVQSWVENSDSEDENKSNMNMLTVVGNKGSIYVMRKSENFDTEAFLIYLTHRKQEILFNDYTYSQIISDSNILSNLSPNEIEHIKIAIKQFSEDTLKEAEKYGIRYQKIQIV